MSSGAGVAIVTGRLTDPPEWLFARFIEFVYVLTLSIVKNRFVWESDAHYTERFSALKENKTPHIKGNA